MKNSTIKNLIDKLNSGKQPDQFFLRPLSENVYWAKLWPEKVTPLNNICTPDGPVDLYFIKNTEGQFVGAVLDMTSDLHWFVLPRFRKQGNLTKALVEVIMPHLFLIKDREIQRITIDKNFLSPKEFQSSEKVATSVGFKKTAEESGTFEYEATKDECQQQIYFEGNNLGITEERRDILCKKINYLSRSLWLIQNEIEMSIGDTDYSKEVNELVLQLKKHAIIFEDKWYENKKHFISITP